MSLSTEGRLKWEVCIKSNVDIRQAARGVIVPSEHSSTMHFTTDPERPQSNMEFKNSKTQPLSVAHTKDGNLIRPSEVTRFVTLRIRKGRTILKKKNYLYLMKTIFL